MDKQKMIDSLAQTRDISYSIWEEYHQKAIEHPRVWGSLRDLYDMRIRSLDYVITMLKKEEN